MGGLPITMLPPALLWIDSGATERIEEFASWSWAGWRNNTALAPDPLGLWKEQAREKCTDMFKLIDGMYLNYISDLRMCSKRVKAKFLLSSSLRYISLNRNLDCRNSICTPGI